MNESGPGAPANVRVEALRFWRREVEVQALRGGDAAAYGVRPLAGVVAGFLLAVVVGVAPTVVDLVREGGNGWGGTGPETTEGPGEPGPSEGYGGGRGIRTPEGY